MRLLFFFIFFTSILIESKEVSSKEALSILIQGNERYVQDKMRYSDHSKDRRSVLLSRQNPFAIIVGCSDSRVPPEIIFDQGLGDLFIVRVAGNVVGAIEYESVSFAASYLKAPLILVLGHEGCGAVEAVLQKKDKAIPEIAALIRPAVALSKSCKPPILDCVIKENVKHIVEDLKRRPLIADLIKKKRLSVVGGYYNLQDGKVEILEAVKE